MVSQELTTKNAGQTQELAEHFGKRLKGGEVLALYGDLGSGKTTFVQGLACGLGIKKRILSPTFTIIRSYILRSRPYILYHIDLYRINSAQEMEGLGLKELLKDPKNILAIEWAEKIEKILPKKRWEINFKHLSQDKRRIIIRKVSR